MGEFEPEHLPSHQEHAKRDESLDENMKSVHRGIWAEKLKNGEVLPVGGSIFSKKLTTKLELDFESFDRQLENFTKEKFLESFEKAKESIKEWLVKSKCDIDPYLFFVCYNVQQKIKELLEVDPTSPSTGERHKMFNSGKMPKISDLKGKSECAERAALGQYLFQKIGMGSAYMSGVTMDNANDEDEFPEDHSFIVIKHLTPSGNSLVFDIARPKSQHNLPRILETNVPLSYELFKDKDNLVVQAREVLQGGIVWFGVGDPVSGGHKSIPKKEELL